MVELKKLVQEKPFLFSSSCILIQTLYDQFTDKYGINNKHTVQQNSSFLQYATHCTNKSASCGLEAINTSVQTKEKLYQKFSVLFIEVIQCSLGKKPDSTQKHFAVEQLCS